MKVPSPLVRLVSLVERSGAHPSDVPPEPASEAELEAGPAPGPAPDTEPVAPLEPALTLAPPPPEPEPDPEPRREPEPPPTVVPLVPRETTPRAWNLWELERLAEQLDGGSAGEERRLLLLHLREYADPAGDLPLEFDPLIREAFGEGLAGLAP